ncbi:hypothetical protein TRFO_21666 [Tritrichomonas foetus]|uniref:Uncharacterized protein n=1 Tax=Tritrichomonas foetus TaxID=1144522 RepID=A0A1J4KER8_9EUKA|nr:hypothetical protein TRFO_21666 [Tritrichomonas foetus]|eukprot:OHT09432.1 hypothetical protein TRFO_21666 [Tritrichomonas foetus]
MRNKLYIIHVAPLCTIYELMNIILLCEGRNKMRILENASTIIRYINLNIQDTLQIANSYYSMSLYKYLVNLIQAQLTSRLLYTDSSDNWNYSIFICPKFITPPFDPLFIGRLLQFTSEITRDIVLSLIKNNKIAQTHQHSIMEEFEC